MQVKGVVPFQVQGRVEYYSLVNSPVNTMCRIVAMTCFKTIR